MSALRCRRRRRSSSLASVPFPPTAPAAWPYPPTTTGAPPMTRTTTEPIRTAFADPTAAAAQLRPGVHAIRVPGEVDHLPVELAEHTLFGFRLQAGGREFVSTPVTRWPALELAVGGEVATR